MNPYEIKSDKLLKIALVMSKRAKRIRRRRLSQQPMHLNLAACSHNRQQPVKPLAAAKD